MKYFSILITLLLTGCLGMPNKVEPISNFELDRYLGTWYEVARLDHSFERGLSHVTASYTMRDDGGVRVINKGYSASDSKWQQAEGKAYFVEHEDLAYLKVSFFGPFYGSYVVFELDEKDYQYAFVSGPDTAYLWLLARSPEVSDEVLESFKAQAKNIGFNTKDLILVDHTPIK
ncbi:lipocalin family protein [Vibrio maerlii]|uniref:lipocalin family protein n=1 Tax=Vibrio maerlii TaxID=2231648 RepID=UPI000E3EA482|nr:lipocalin family protein [Vibrio maerlii]